MSIISKTADMLQSTYISPMTAYQIKGIVIDMETILDKSLHIFEKTMINKSKFWRNNSIHS